MAEAILRVNDAQFDRAKRLLQAIAGGVELAGSKAINDTLRFIRASAVRKIKAKININAKNIRNRIFVTKATRATQRGKMSVTQASSIGLFFYSARQVKKGVTYSIRRGQKRKLIPGAFIHEGRPYVFVREFADLDPSQLLTSGERAFEGEDFAGKKRVGRRPIRPVFGPSIGTIFKDEVQQTIEAEAADKLEERLEFHVDALLRKAGL